MNSAYDDNGTPINLLCFNHPVAGAICEFTNLPDVKYFDGGFTWVLMGSEGESKAKIQKGIRSSSKAMYECVKEFMCPFSELSPEFQSFVRKYYEDTFGLFGEEIEK